MDILFIIPNFNLDTIRHTLQIVSTLLFTTSTMEQFFITLRRVKTWPVQQWKKFRKNGKTDFCMNKKHG